jgi:TolB protein
MDADGRNLRRLTVDPGTEGEPVWTPDGARVIYTSTPKTGLPQLASIRLDGTDNRALTTAPGGNWLADVSPDGSKIAFVSTREGNSKIFEMALDGSGPHRVTRGSDRESHPRFLPNGDLVYTVEKGGGSRVQRLAGDKAATVLEIDQPVLALDVSRDGGRVAYSAGKIAEGGKGKTRIVLMLRPLAAGSTPTPVPLRPGEQILSLSF